MIQDMIETLAAAKVAMEENPQLKAQIQELQTLVNDLRAVNTELTLAHQGLNISHEMLATKRAELEAELEAARFRELATHSKLDKLVSSFNAAISEVVPASDPVTDQPSGDVVVEHAEVLAEATVPEVKFSPFETNDERTATAEDFSPSSEQPSAKPYADRPSSFKPQGMSWVEWVNGGGGRPFWLTDDELERLKKAAA